MNGSVDVCDLRPEDLLRREGRSVTQLPGLTSPSIKDRIHCVGLTMQRKPMWLVEVSTVSLWRAAGR